MSQSVPTLFDKYGGVPTVRKIVRQFHERFAASPALRRYFENVDAEKFIKHHAELIAYTLGRPTESFDPHKMAQQHHPHDISASSFEQVINILRQVLLDANFEGRDIAHDAMPLLIKAMNDLRDVQPLNDIYQPEHVDALTGLGNQGALMSALSEECVHYQKEQRPLSLAIIRPAPYGREALPTDHTGIQLLDRHLTGALSRTARRADTLCRHSDGLFALVLRATDAGKALQAVRRIHAAVTRELFATATGKQRIDLAIGLASCSNAVSSAELLLLAAERAIGSAGQAGQMIVVA